MIAVLCDASGNTLLGSDGYFYVDGRCRIGHWIDAARSYRDRFRKNFPHKANHWTHVMFVSRIADLPDSYNGRSMPRRHGL